MEDSVATIEENVNALLVTLLLKLMTEQLRLYYYYAPVDNIVLLIIINIINHIKYNFIHH